MSSELGVLARGFRTLGFSVWDSRILDPVAERALPQGLAPRAQSLNPEIGHVMPELELDVPTTHLLGEAVVLGQAHLPGLWV